VPVGEAELVHTLWNAWNTHLESRRFRDRTLERRAALAERAEILARTRAEAEADIAAAGARRVSLGSWLTMTAVAAAADAATQMRDAGSFAALRAPAGISDWLAG